MQSNRPRRTKPKSNKKETTAMKREMATARVTATAKKAATRKKSQKRCFSVSSITIVNVPTTLSIH